MGIGRFAFTPLLPMMLHDGVIDLHAASWLASTNYVGYLVGALLCTFQPMLWRLLGALPMVQPATCVRAGLAATCVLTLGMAAPLPAAWPVLRFLAGIASAVVFVYTSGWCLGRLARLNVPAMGGMIYTGPGGGIVISGLIATMMVAVQWTAATGWLIFGTLAVLLTVVVWPIFKHHPDDVAQPPSTASANTATPTSATPANAGSTEVALLAFAYGLAGFGYIITATFLPVIARSALPGSVWLDMFWPLFGLGVIGGALLATRISASGDRRALLAGCYAVQAVGVVTSVVWPTLAGFALSSLLLGLPFTAITFFAMQEVRRVRPWTAPSVIGLLTAIYGLGQIAGPPLASWLIQRSSAGAGFTLSLEIAATTLLVGSAVFVAMVRIYPVRATAA